MTQEWVPVQPETPELDRMIERSKDGHSQAIGEFIEWLQDEGYVITRESDDDYFPLHETIEQWLAMFFGIDLVKVEEERAAVLAFVRSQNEERGDG